MEADIHENMQKTPLYDIHIAAGGKMVNFHGWLLPVQYVGILQEHECVRTHAGLFDVSHMGEIEVSGEDAFDFLQRMLVNDIVSKPGKAVYSPMCYPDGGTVDDLILYKQTDNSYLLVVNAANTIKDYQWLKENKTGRVTVINRSDEYAQLALQGPNAADVLKKLTREDLDQLRFFGYIPEVDAGGIKVMLSRTGYTGEDGFEIYCRPEDAGRLWYLLMESGAPSGLSPVGLGARDTLRLEAAFPLYGQELSEGISPVMAGLKRFVRMEKADFIGREALAAQLQGNVKLKLAGFEMIDRAVPRNGYEIYSGEKKVGYVTSGGFFPTLRKNMGLALLDTACADEGATIEVQVRNGLYNAKIVKLPFYKRA